jgi:hypothetical protein
LDPTPPAARGPDPALPAVAEGDAADAEEEDVAAEEAPQAAASPITAAATIHRFVRFESNRPAQVRHAGSTSLAEASLYETSTAGVGATPLPPLLATGGPDGALGAGLVVASNREVVARDPS